MAPFCERCAVLNPRSTCAPGFVDPARTPGEVAGSYGAKGGFHGAGCLQR